MYASEIGALNDRLGEDGAESEGTIEDDQVTDNCDYIVLGYVKVPLLQLITKNNGVDGDFTIFDEFNQNMGQLRLRITLNHHNSRRPLYSASTKIPNQVVPANAVNKTNHTLIEKSITLNSKVRTHQLSREQSSK